MRLILLLPVSLVACIPAIHPPVKPLVRKIAPLVGISWLPTLGLLGISSAGLGVAISQSKKTGALEEENARARNDIEKYKKALAEAQTPPPQPAAPTVPSK
jgi:hypothetical protein